MARMFRNRRAMTVLALAALVGVLFKIQSSSTQSERALGKGGCKQGVLCPPHDARARSSTTNTASPLAGQKRGSSSKPGVSSSRGTLPSSDSGAAPWAKYHFVQPGTYTYTEAYGDGDQNPFGVPTVRFEIPKLVKGVWHQDGAGDKSKHDVPPSIVATAWRAPVQQIVAFGTPGDMSKCTPPIEHFRFPLVVGASWGGPTNCGARRAGQPDRYEKATVLRKEQVGLGDGTKVDAFVIFFHTLFKGFQKDFSQDFTAWVLPSNGLYLYQEWGGTSWSRLQSLTPEPL